MPAARGHASHGSTASTTTTFLITRIPHSKTISIEYPSHQACALPVLTYGLPLWFAENGTGIKSRLSKINKVHSHACKWITGCFCTTPIGAREVIAGLPPLVTLLNAQLHGFLQEQFEHAVDPQRPGQRVLDLFDNRITIDTSSPKKGTASFKAWVRDLKTEIEQLHDKPENVVVYTDGAFHHSNYKAAFAFTIPQGDTWYDRAIEAALEHTIERTPHDHITMFIDNKAAANSLFNFEVKSSQMSIVRINWLLKAWLSENCQ
ncbi:hypothetical protein AX14_008007 [Amanita brunnescens Koide BX004]|nr:hypothetical protein AX14_008007 [Amanita brunnescens Koide BX004]